MPPRALKHDRWELAQAKAFVSEPPLNTHTAATNTWPILQGSKEQILRQHPDPLRALHEGDVAAVVLRSRLAPTDAAALVRVLRKSIKSPDLSPLPPSRGGRKGNTIPQSRWKARGTSLHTLGADLHYSLKHQANFPTAAEHAAYAQGYTQLVESLGLGAAVRALHGGLRDISAGRRVGTAVDPRTNTSYSHGVFRMHHPGNTFPLHVDSLWAAGWNARTCGTGGLYQRNATRRILARATEGNRIADLAADPLRFRYQFSALLLLQPPRPTTTSAGPAPDVTLFDPHIEDIVKDCELSGLSHSVGVHVKGFDKSRRFNTARMHNLSLEAGDLYVFNSNRLHAVPPVLGQRDRIALGTFLGYSSKELLVWA